MKKLIAFILLFLLSFNVFAERTSLNGVLDLSGICFTGSGLYCVLTPDNRTDYEITCGWIAIGIGVGLFLFSGYIQANY